VEYLLHLFLELVGSVWCFPGLKNLVKPWSFDVMQFFKSMLVGHVLLVHLLVDAPLLDVNIHARSVKDWDGKNSHAVDQSHHILLAGMKYFYPLGILKQLLDFLHNHLV
jgi:hypothetical protein